MELKDFIEWVILDIEWAKENISSKINKQVQYWKNSWGFVWVDFDLMVINEEWKIWKWSWWIKVLWANIWGELEGNNKIINTNRIKFAFFLWH